MVLRRFSEVLVLRRFSGSSQEILRTLSGVFWRLHRGFQKFLRGFSGGTQEVLKRFSENSYVVLRGFSEGSQ